MNPYAYDSINSKPNSLEKVEEKDILNFFIEYINNENLG